MSKYMELLEDYLTEVYGDGQISYIHEDCVAGARMFAEWLDRQLVVEVSESVGSDKI